MFGHITSLANLIVIVVNKFSQYSFLLRTAIFSHIMMIIATANNKTNNHTSNTKVIKEKRVLKQNLDLLKELGKIKHVWVSYTINTLYD